MNNKKTYIGLLLIVILTIITFLLENIEKNEMINNGEATSGVITKYIYSNYSYTLYFEYYANGIKYEKAIGTGFFTCDDGTKGCVGKKFKVIYSKKNPKKCFIDLGKFNEKKYR
jgi:hypothetical protein